MERPEHLRELVDQLERRFEYVITMGRHELREDEMDAAQGKGAFAFVVGGDSDNALVMECSITGDGAEANITLWGLVKGGKVPLTLTEFNGELLVSHPLPH